MTEEILAGNISDKADLKHQLIDTTTLSGYGTTIALPIFKVQDRETLDIPDRWMTAGTRSVGTSFVWGHPWYGLFGTHATPQNVFGDQRNAITIVRIIQPNNIYNEIFYDTQFRGTVTNGTWDTSNHRATIGAIGTIQSSQIYMNNATVTSALMIVSYVGSVNLFMSANGGTAWQECNMGTTLTFSTAGTDLRWKATSNACTISSLNISFI